MNLSEKYSILQRCGAQRQRKFSEVFLVENRFTGNKCVLKHLTKTPENQLLQHRLREESTFSFNQKGLPDTVDIFESETELAIVRSYSPGVPLREWLVSYKSKERIFRLTEVLHGLQPLFACLRANRVVHLDIKPSNIIVQSQPSSSPDVSLIDFGMALHLAHPDQRNTLFPLGYAAPELLLNRLHLADERTDLFALGIVIWQQLTGKLPLLHPNPSVTTNLQLTHPLPTHSDIPAPVFHVLQRMCHKHTFRLPPNQLPPEETDRCLKEAIAQRFDDYDDFLASWEKATTQRTGFRSWFR